MKHHKKKKRSKACKQVGVGNGSLPSGNSNDEGESVVTALTDVFSAVSVEEAKCAYKEANGDLNKAMGILGDMVECKEEDKITSCSSSSGIGSSLDSRNSDVFVGGHSFQRKAKTKKLVAATGTVSAMIGKDYVRTTPNKSCSKFKGLNAETTSNDDVEQFLYSMLGEDSDLSLAVVRDVLCQCGYEVEKFTDRTSDSTSHTSEGEVLDNVWLWGPPGRTSELGEESSLVKTAFSNFNA